MGRYGKKLYYGPRRTGKRFDLEVTRKNWRISLSKEIVSISSFTPSCVDFANFCKTKKVSRRTNQETFPFDLKNNSPQFGGTDMAV